MSNSGALTQLAALGPQNVWLNADATITYWKGGYRRYTNFAIAEIEQNFSSNTLSASKKSLEIDRAGDLLGSVYLHMHVQAADYGSSVPLDFNGGDYCYLTNSVGHAAIAEASITIGSQTIDSHTGEYLEAWESLSAPAEKALAEMVGYSETVEGLVNYSRQEQDLYVPFRFWHNRFYEQALPLIALQYHKVVYNLTCRTIEELRIFAGSVTSSTMTTMPDVDEMNLLCSYVFLDVVERRLFAQNAHEYLFDQVQFTGVDNKASGDSTKNIQLNFNHPTKELIWLCRRTAVEDDLDWFNFGGVPTSGSDPLPTDAFTTVEIQVNGHTRVIALPAVYFRTVQPYQYHSRIPGRHVYCYNFGLFPEDVKPSGSINLSRIDKTIMKFVFPTGSSAWAGGIYVFARSINVLKILSGMAGVLYA